MGTTKMRRFTGPPNGKTLTIGRCVNQVKKRSTMRQYLFAAATLLQLSLNPVLAQDAANGEDVFKKCRTCHQVGDSAKNSVGPILNGIIGRPAGTMAGFSYSPANKEAGSKGLVWSEENLFKYLENPTVFMPKTKMIFPGIKDEQDRKDLIAYLKKFP
jgi:cytochrome c